MGSIPRPSIFRIPLLQLAVLLFFGVVTWWGLGLLVMLSWVLGGLVYVVPSFIFAVLVFRFQGARAAQAIFISLMRAEAWKFGFSALAFALVFALFKSLNTVIFFVAYLLMALIWLVAAARVIRTSSPPINH